MLNGLFECRVIERNCETRNREFEGNKNNDTDEKRRRINHNDSYFDQI